MLFTLSNIWFIVQLHWDLKRNWRVVSSQWTLVKSGYKWISRFSIYYFYQEIAIWTTVVCFDKFLGSFHWQSMSPAWQNDNNTSKQSADPAGWFGVTEGGIVGSRVPAAYCAGADNMVDTNTVIEGTVKFRDGKKVSRFLIFYIVW